MCQFSNKLLCAVRTLAADGAIKKRLISAYSENLALLPDDDIPESIRPRFERLRKNLHAIKPLPTESAVVASVRKMSVEEANQCATSIVIMFSELVRVKTTGERLQPITSVDGDDPTNGTQHHRAALN